MNDRQIAKRKKKNKLNTAYYNECDSHAKTMAKSVGIQVKVWKTFSKQTWIPGSSRS